MPGADLRSSLPAPVEEGEEEEDIDRVRAWLADRQDSSLPMWLRDALGSVASEAASSRGLRVVALPSESAPGFLVLLGRRRVRSGCLDASTDDDSASHPGVEVPLAVHMDGVGAKARSFAGACGFDTALGHDVAFAARYHDLGKADPRFQRMLRGGSLLRTKTAPELIAKSAIPAGDWVARQAARAQAGYPKGGGHELLSVALLEGSPLQGQVHDWPLVLHLVGAHHGGCRPLAPFIEDQNPIDVTVAVDGVELRANSAHGLERLDSGVSERFWKLNDAYGWYGLAWLEAVVRLSDHRQSEEEQTGGRHE
jgi:CRISPR-associated endonuclease/helicase Cas3